MPTQNNILDRGFRNLREAGEIVGFQVLVRDGYYRGIYLPIIEGFDVWVDGQDYTGERIKYKFHENVYTAAELQKHPDERWQWGEACTVFVSKPGGLKPGFHDVKITVKERISYMPVIPTVRSFSATLALVS